MVKIVPIDEEESEDVVVLPDDDDDDDDDEAVAEEDRGDDVRGGGAASASANSSSSHPPAKKKAGARKRARGSVVGGGGEGEGKGGKNGASGGKKKRTTSKDDDGDKGEDGEEGGEEGKEEGKNDEVKSREEEEEEEEEIIAPKPSPSKLGLFDPQSSSTFKDRAEQMRRANLLLHQSSGSGSPVGGRKTGALGGAAAKRAVGAGGATQEDYGEDDYSEEDDYGDYSEEDGYGDECGDEDEEERYYREMARQEEKAKVAAAAKKASAAAGAGGSKKGGGGPAGLQRHVSLPDEDEEESYYGDDYYDKEDEEMMAAAYGDEDEDDGGGGGRSTSRWGRGRSSSSAPTSRNGRHTPNRSSSGVSGGWMKDEMDDDPNDYSDPAVLRRRIRRRLARDTKSSRAEQLISFDLSRDLKCPSSWTVDMGEVAAAAAKKSAAKKGGGGRKKGGGYGAVMDEQDEEEERARSATAAVGTIFQEIGVVVLRSGGEEEVDEEEGDGSDDEELPAKMKAEGEGRKPKAEFGSSAAPVEIVDDSDDDNAIDVDREGDAKAPAAAVVGVPPKPGGSSAFGSEVEFVCSKKAGGTTDRRPVRLIPPHLLERMVEQAMRIEREVCDRLDERGEPWRPAAGLGSSDGGGGDGRSDEDGGDEKKDDGGENLKMPSRETAAKERARKKSDGGPAATEATCNFKYKEVASRCPGRLDVRHRMDEPPFNDPRVIRNPILLPLVQSMLGGPGGGARLVYAGLIFSFPGSSDQPWHMDGTALFPEERSWLDLPPYAVNVFIPLGDVTDEVGPTEFLPASHLASRAASIDDDLLQWAMAESRRQALASAAASGSELPPHLLLPQSQAFSEEDWMRRHSVIAPLMSRGDALIYDYRSCHRGTRNLRSSKRTRTMLYLMYARPWFREHLNFGTERLFDEKVDKGGNSEEDSDDKPAASLKVAAKACAKIGDDAGLGSGKYLV